MRMLIVEDEPYVAEAIRDGLRLEAIAAGIAGDGDTALELLNVNATTSPYGRSGDFTGDHNDAADDGEQDRLRGVPAPR